MGVGCFFVVAMALFGVEAGLLLTAIVSHALLLKRIQPNHASHVNCIQFSESHPLQIALQIYQEPYFSELHGKLLTSLQEMTKIRDPAFRKLALSQLDHMSERFAELASGTVVFQGTDTWRLVYDEILSSSLVHHYRSVAWIQNDGYWQDEPGRKSFSASVQLMQQCRLQIERIVIVSDHQWDFTQELPKEEVLRWIISHRDFGIPVRVVKQSHISHEQSLVSDFGIYGSHIAGELLLGEHGKTREFKLHFNLQEVRKAEIKWNKLLLYSVSIEELLA